MTYSPECVAAFEAKFPDVSGMAERCGKAFYFCPNQGRYVGWPIHEHSIAFANGRLAAFAANWERVRELEEAIALHKTVTEKMPYPTSSDKKLWKLLEKGNE